MSFTWHGSSLLIHKVCSVFPGYVRLNISVLYPPYRTLWQQVTLPFNRSSVLTCVSPSVRAVYLYFCIIEKGAFHNHLLQGVKDSFLCITEFQHFLSFVFVDQNDACFKKTVSAFPKLISLQPWASWRRTWNGPASCWQHRRCQGYHG